MRILSLFERQGAWFLAVAITIAVISNTDYSSATDGSSTRSSAAYRAEAMANPLRPNSNQVGSPQATAVKRLREGTIINDQTGYFRENGDGASFVADSGIEFGALRNLNLERVVKLLKNAEEPSSVRWSVTGKVTEFAGRNYILISRSVYKSATPPPVPDRVTQ